MPINIGYPYSTPRIKASSYSYMICSHKVDTGPHSLCNYSDKAQLWSSQCKDGLVQHKGLLWFNPVWTKRFRWANSPLLSSLRTWGCGWHLWASGCVRGRISQSYKTCQGHKRAIDSNQLPINVEVSTINQLTCVCYCYAHLFDNNLLIVCSLRNSSCRCEQSCLQGDKAMCNFLRRRNDSADIASLIS